MPNLSIPEFSRMIAAFGEWTLYQRQEDARASFLWVQLKLQRPPGTPRRRGQPGAFWLAWSPLKLRFARGAYPEALAEKYPDLGREVEMYLSLNYDRSWLCDPNGLGYSDAEIEAELDRLQKARKARLLELKNKGWVRSGSETAQAVRLTAAIRAHDQAKAGED